MSTEGRHLDRLTAVDASFLTNESSTSHMHVGAILIFEGPPPKYVDLVEHVRGRLTLVPRFRQKLVVPPLEAGRPLWADDVNFNLTYHIRHTALPEPGGEAQLKRLAGRVFSQQLDRSKPLWELWLAQGLERDRFAILTKTHHAMVDGISGVDIGTVLFDLEPVPRAGAGRRRLGAAARTGDDRAGRARGQRPGRGAGQARRAGRRGGAQPGDDGAQGGRGAGGAERDRQRLRRPGPGRAAEPADRAAPPLRLGALGAGDLQADQGRARGHRQRRRARRRHRRACATGCTRRGIRTEGLELRALVPVSIRSEDERGNLGNRIALMRGPLPVYVEDPVRRLRTISQEMEGLKRSKQALGAEVISRFNDFAPPTLLAQASRINFSTRLFNLIVTNVPGPQLPLYVLGRELEEVFPVAFLPQNHALAVAIMSYNGKVGFGLLADYDSMEDVEALADGLNESLAELEQAAGAAAAAA